MLTPSKHRMPTFASQLAALRLHSVTGDRRIRESNGGRATTRRQRWFSRWYKEVDQAQENGVRTQQPNNTTAEIHPVISKYSAIRTATYNYIPPSSVAIKVSLVATCLRYNDTSMRAHVDTLTCDRSMLVASSTAISCQDQANSKGPVCMANTQQACPQGYRPVFYDDPYPYKNGQRCCIIG